MKQKRLCIVSVLSVLAFGTAAQADVVTEWNATALNVIRSSKTPPPVAARALAILHLAIYDAVNGISRTHDAYMVPSSAPASASREAAATAAAHTALKTLFPSFASTFDMLNTQLLGGIPNRPSKDKGVQWGEAVANQILLSRAGDGFDAIVAVPSMTPGPGAWVSTPPAFAAYLLPNWGFVGPFVMPASAFFRPLGPPALASAKYASDYNEVKSLGSALGNTGAALSIRRSSRTRVEHIAERGQGAIPERESRLTWGFCPSPRIEESSQLVIRARGA